jgi:uncharacterized membrane protein
MMADTERSKTSTAALPFHLAESVEAVAQIHSDHHLNRTRLERLIDNGTARLARPYVLIVVVGAVALWVAINLFLHWSGRALDAPPFPWMSGTLTLLGLLMGILILSTQRRADRLAVLREQMTLELASVTERKVAKLIELIEELRRDSPALPNRVDHEAAQMSARSNPSEVLVAIKESHDEIGTKGTVPVDPGSMPKVPSANE